MGGFISGLTYGSLSLQPVDLLAPLVGADQASTQPTGTCTSGLSTVWSPAPPPDITTETTGQFSLAGLSPLERQLASLQPLIEPDRRISRIRLSEKTHTELGRHVTPSATSEHNRGVARLVVNPRVLCCFLRQSLTEASSLHRHYPASSVLQASPSPQAAQPASHEVPVDRQGDHRWGFPCCYWSTLPTCRRHYPGRSDGTRSLVLFHQRRPAHITRGEGSCVNRFEACSAFTSRYGLQARQVTYVTLYTGGSDGFVSSTAAPIASGWSEPSSRGRDRAEARAPCNS
jgi:hypothetical protein